MMDIEKSNKTRATLKATRDRRKGQSCKVFELKIDYSHLNKDSREKLGRIFLEAKWLYNFVLSSDNCFEFSGNTDVVKIKVKDKFEDREINILGSQMRQSVIEGLKQNILNLSKRKKGGGRVGKLKYITKYSSIDLKQFGNTYKIEGKRIKIQNIKQWMIVSGINQIANKGYEFANAKLIHKSSGYYLKVTCYKENENKFDIRKKAQVGLDFGIATQITISNGIDVKYNISPPIKKMRKICRDFSKKESHSSNWYKKKNKLSKQYEKITNQKKDTKNKLMHIFKNEFSVVCYQNESVKAWQKIWGKRILNTAIGGITASLKKTPTSVMVDKFFPSTKQCPKCQHKESISLEQRVFVCSKCGYTKPRDLKAAEMIRDEGLKKIGAERIEFKPVEMKTNTEYLLGKLNAIHRVKASFVAEAGSPSYL